MTLSLAVMRRLREAADLGHFSHAGTPLTEQAADLAHHMLHTFGEALPEPCKIALVCSCCRLCCPYCSVLCRRRPYCLLLCCCCFSRRLQLLGRLLRFGWIVRAYVVQQ